MPRRATGKTAGKTAAKLPAKTARSPLTGAEIPLGAHAGNTGGKKGRSGRPPKAFKEFASALADDAAFQERLRLACLMGDMQAAKLIIEHAVGRPPQAVQHTGKDGGPVEITVTRRIVRPENAA